MAFALAGWYAGPHPSIEIDESRYRDIERAERLQRVALQIEEKFDLVITNFEEFESSLMALTTRHMLRRDLPWSRMSADRLLLNRRLVNLLSTCRLYSDQVSHDLRSAPLQIDEERAKRLFSERYDASLGYRVMEGLRNQLQHHSIPITGITYASAQNDGITAFRIDLALDLDVLATGGFKRNVLEELRDLQKEQVDVILFAREYVEGLAKVHHGVRSLIEDDVEKADEIMGAALLEWQNAGHSPTGFTAVNVAEDGSRRQEVHIGTSFRERRAELATMNHALQTLSRRSVTSARPAASYT